MTLSELIIRFRTERGLSQRQLASRCNLSTGYISLIEKEINPQTHKRMVPTLTVLNKLADGMDMSIDELFMLCDDMPVNIAEKDEQIIPENENNLLEEEAILLSLFRQVNPEGQEAILKYAQLINNAPEYKKGDKSALVEDA